ncbi:MAG: patatin-like protein [Elainella sp. Prado103]|jgi:patatin-related protein|nr:patatin-like protein [Elainella sp. Prado103]
MQNLSRAIDPASSSQVRQDQSQDKPEFRHEARLGLVVYGGVSLAIYMNGVCREFYNAVRGRGIYKLVKALTDSDIVVDVISGTSAGGINGVLLSYALANSNETRAVDFKNFANIWRDSGDIKQLLRTPDLKLRMNGFQDGEGTTNSLLNGEGFYQQQLAGAFKEAWDKRTENVHQIESEWYSPADELDLFVTGTDTLGRVSRAFDNTGSLIEVKDHRTVFLLKHRQGRKEPFQPNPQNQQALGTLCRITSCFPVAFPVVSVQLPVPIEGNPSQLAPVSEIDRRLVYWGQLTNRELPLKKPKTGYQLHFVDGGVLDNRPFSYTIRQIYYRVAYRPVTRKLFYIDPSPDRFLNSPKFNQMAKPNIWETVADSLVGLPRYESIAGDLQDIKDRNERVLRYKFLRGTAERTGKIKLEQARKQLTHASPAVSEDEIPKSQQVYLRCRLVRLRDRVLPLLLRIDQIGNLNATNGFTSQDKQKLLEQAAQLITKYIADQKHQAEREEFLHDLGRKIRNLDVDYALRKHFFLLEKICQSMTDLGHPGSVQALDTEHGNLKTLATQIGNQIKLLEVIQFALDKMLTSEPVSRTFYALIDEASQDQLPDPRDIFSPDEMLQSDDRNTRKDTRIYIYQYLLRLHRFLLDADGLVPFEPEQQPQRALAIDEPTTMDRPAAIPVDFFHNLTRELTPQEISGVLLQLQAKARLLDDQMLGLQRAGQLGRKDQLDPLPEQTLWRNQKYTYRSGSENDSEYYSSILRKVEQLSEQLIRSCGSLQSEQLLDTFQSFRFIDEEVYSYEYLSDIQAKEQVEVVQISPDAAQLGFGKNRGLADKLAGDQLNAFGGFFKKSWRSNDILWGRLDGVNRIVEALLTPAAIQRFPAFIQRQLPDVQVPGHPNASAGEKIEFYLSQLLQDALPAALPLERELLLKALTRLATLADPHDLPVDNPARLADPLTDREFAQFLNTLVTAGQRSILKSDLQNVLQDTMAEQIDWNQQLVKPDQQGFQKMIAQLKLTQPIAASNLGNSSQPQKVLPQALSLLTGSEPQKVSPPEQQLALDQLTGFLLSLLSPRPQQAQKYLEKNAPQTLLETAFYHAQQSDPQNLQRLSQLMQTLPTDRSIDQLYEFFRRLNTAKQCELKQCDVDTRVHATLSRLEQQLMDVLNRLKPKYEPMSGYFDRAITPFAIQELAKEPVQNLVQNLDQIDDYFRNTYRVGSEKLAQDVPTVVLEDLLAKTGLVVRDILNAPPTGDRLRNTTTFRFINRLLQGFYLWTQSKNPKAPFLPALLRSIPSWILPVVIIGGVAFLVSRLPQFLLVLIITLAIIQLLRNLLQRPTGGYKLNPWLLGALVVLLGMFLLIAPRFLPEGTINLPLPFSNLQISIQSTQN